MGQLNLPIGSNVYIDTPVFIYTKMGFSKLAKLSIVQ
jgi:hypothetical protein